MNRFGSLFEPLMWFIALLLAAFVAGCGGGDDEGAPFAGVRTCEGQECVDLGTASNFAILTSDGIIDNGPSFITGDVGVSTGAGPSNTLSCAEVTGTTFANDATGPAPCSVENAALLTAAETDIGTAFTGASGRTPDFIDPVLTSPLTITTPGVYRFNNDINLTEDLTFSGSGTDVWVIQIPANSLSLAANTSVLLAGGAKAKNVFWRIGGNVALGAGAHLDGVVLASGAVIADTGAVVNGRLYSMTIVTLDTTTVTHPAP